jgi:ABC-type antimicrobial peptide transport system permease subunit
LLLACVAVTVLFTTGLAAVVWTFAARVVPTGALSILADPAGRSIALNGLADAGKAASDAQVIRTTLRRAWPGVGFRMESALWADPIRLQSATSTVFATQVAIGSLDAISSQATLAAGSWPGPPVRGGPVPVALPAGVASRLHLVVGSVLSGSTSSGGASISLRVTGLFRARDPSSSYWSLDLLPVSGTDVQGLSFTYAGLLVKGSSVTYGPAVVNPAAFGGALAATQASWLVLPSAPGLARGNIGGLAASTGAATSRLTVSILPYGLKVTSRLPGLLAGIAKTVVLTRSLFTIAALMLLLVAGAGLVLAARLLASLREEESALLRARGATRWQVTRPVLAEAVAVGIAAGLAGVLAGTRLTGVLAGLGHLRLDDNLGRGFIPVVWLSALAMLLVCVGVMVWPALHVLTPDLARLRRGRQARLARVAWAGGDVAVVALAAVAVWQLRGYSAVAHVGFGAGPGAGSLGIDPVVAVAPALALSGLALIPLRGLPLLARLADKATDYERRLASAMVSWQIARRPIQQAGPALLVIVATATTTLGLAGYASWRQSAADQAAFAIGSDVRVDAAGGLPLGAVGSIIRAPGATAATSASVTGIGSGSQLIALDARTAGKTILLRRDLSRLPLHSLWRRITPRGLSGLTLPGQPDRLKVRLALGSAIGLGARLAAGLRAELGKVMVAAWVSDASGGTYQISAAGSMHADGRAHSLVFTLSGPGEASYPLRLLGFQATYTLPPFDPANPTLAPVLHFNLDSLAVSDTTSGQFARPFRPGAAFRSWLGSALSAYVPTGPPSPFGTIPPSDGAAPSIVTWLAAAGIRQLTFNAGHEPSAKVMLEVNLGPGVATGQVAVSAQPPSPVVPAIATAGYLAANKLSLGAVTTASVDGFPVKVRLVASVARFPTVFGSNRALIADLAEVNDVLVANQMSPLPVTRWWLRTARGRVPRLPAGFGLSVVDRVRRKAALLTNSLLTAPRQAMLAIGVVAVLLGALGFSISVAASLRSRRTQSAVFAALGVGKNAQAGQLCLEQCALSIPAAAAGLLAGIGLARLMVPAITLTVGAAAPVPFALVVLPLGLAVALAVATAALPVAAAALSILRRPDPAAQLRAEAR